MQTQETSVRPPETQTTERKRKLLGSIEPYLFTTPVLILYAVLLAFPVLELVRYSLTESNIFQGALDWNNLDNYRYLATGEFLHTAAITVVWLVGCVGGVVLLGLPMAIVLNAPLPGRALFRSLVIVPWIVPHSFAAIMWSWLFNPQYGIINVLLLRLGVIDSPVIFLSEGGALASAIVVRIWQSAPFMIITLLAALQTVPAELEEAAQIDGANGWQRFRHITLPHIRPVLIASTAIIAAWTLQLFDTVYVLTGGGPNRATEILAVDIYKKVFVESELGMGSAMAVATLAAVGILSWFGSRRGRSSEEGSAHVA